MAAGVAVPRAVWSHGWMTFGGARFSKTAGVRFTLGEAIDRHGPDALRYFLLREVGWDTSGEFSLERFDARYTADLADTLGNLASRTLAMVQSYRGGVVPAAPDAFQSPLEEAAAGTLARYRTAMDENRLHEGAAELIGFAARANQYVQETAPWALAKQQRAAELDAVLATLVRAVLRLAALSAPFMPGKADALWTVLGTPQPLAGVRLSDLAHPAVEGLKVAKPPALFPKPLRVA
jgi:methionyl-tRNA synthetase